MTGERFRFHSRPRDPETDPLELDLWATPDMSPLAEHVHPRRDETFAVNDGAIDVSRNGVGTTFTAGEVVTVEAGTPHTWSNAGAEQLHLTVRFRSGLETEAFLRDLAALARQGAVETDGAPSVLQVAAMYDSYGYELHLPREPAASRPEAAVRCARPDRERARLSDEVRRRRGHASAVAGGGLRRRNGSIPRPRPGLAGECALPSARPPPPLTGRSRHRGRSFSDRTSAGGDLRSLVRSLYRVSITGSTSRRG